MLPPRESKVDYLLFRKAIEKAIATGRGKFSGSSLASGALSSKRSPKHWSLSAGACVLR